MFTLDKHLDKRFHCSCEETCAHSHSHLQRPVRKSGSLRSLRSRLSGSLHSLRISRTEESGFGSKTSLDSTYSSFTAESTVSQHGSTSLYMYMYNGPSRAVLTQVKVILSSLDFHLTSSSVSALCFREEF